MDNDIRAYVKGCAKCQAHGTRQQKEPMQSFEIPAAPGLVVASEHFFLGGKTYVLFTDTFSMWTEFFRVPSTNANHLIRALRQFVSRNGIPRVLTADQGSAYTSGELKEFAETMEMQIRVGSVKYSQGNAHAEAAVKRVKKWLKRCNSEDELCLAILSWHQTPVAPGRPSPAEIHLGRNVRDGLTWRVEQSMVEWKDVQQWRELRNQEAKKHYNRGSRILTELSTQEAVWVWNGGEKKWESGIVLEKLDRPRAYLVELKDGSRIERNRRDLKPDRSWHSKTNENGVLGAFQEWTKDRHGEQRERRGGQIAAIRGRHRDDGGTEGGVARGHAGDENHGWIERDDERGAAEQPVHAAPDDSATARVLQALKEGQE